MKILAVALDVKPFPGLVGLAFSSEWSVEVHRNPDVDYPEKKNTPLVTFSRIRAIESDRAAIGSPTDILDTHLERVARVHGIIGANGCGKTSLLIAFARMLYDTTTSAHMALLFDDRGKVQYWSSSDFEVVHSVEYERSQVRPEFEIVFLNQSGGLFHRSVDGTIDAPSISHDFSQCTDLDYLLRDSAAIGSPSPFDPDIDGGSQVPLTIALQRHRSSEIFRQMALIQRLRAATVDLSSIGYERLASKLVSIGYLIIRPLNAAHMLNGLLDWIRIHDKELFQKSENFLLYLLKLWKEKRDQFRDASVISIFVGDIRANLISGPDPTSATQALLRVAQDHLNGMEPCSHLDDYVLDPHDLQLLNAISDKNRQSSGWLFISLSTTGLPELLKYKKVLRYLEIGWATDDHSGPQRLHLSCIPGILLIFRVIPR